MDYTREPLLFRFLKVARYARLYGPSRTLVKIRGQYHTKRNFAELPEPRPTAGSGQHVGILGCGNFAYSVIAYYLRKNHGNVIRAAMDTHIERAASLFQAYGMSYYTDDASKVIADPEIDLIYVASNRRGSRRLAGTWPRRAAMATRASL
ncbi:MAG: hypothetical protein CL910_09300 [Deltaproteobacteria bacterium]|jgi:hypothetical protein|nr:hypothetical protein [Deltaproteobacteria bacterium]